MANQNNSAKQGLWDKIVMWYASKAYAVGIVYSLGASVVIIGALFKILHWPGASYVLMVGMFTEALLFTLGIFEKPHAAYHWEHVFPQLIGDETKELKGGSGTPSVAAGSQVNALPEEEIKALKEGIANLGKTAQQLASIGEIAETSVKLNAAMNKASEGLQTASAGITQNLDKASVAAEQVAVAYQTVSAEMQTVVNTTKVYGKGIEQVSSYIASLNSVYELQLKDLNAQQSAFKQQTEKVNAVSAIIDKMTKETEQMQQSASASLKASEQMQESQQKLAQQIATLNQVYGNMLNALA